MKETKTLAQSVIDSTRPPGPVKCFVTRENAPGMPAMVRVMCPRCNGVVTRHASYYSGGYQSRCPKCLVLQNVVL